MLVAKKILISAFIIGILPLIYTYNPYSWRNTCRKDVEAIRDILTENHPGFYDDQNPLFKEWLSQGFCTALKKCERVTSAKDYMQVLTVFAAGFKDTHLWINFRPSLITQPVDTLQATQKQRLSSARDIGPKQAWVTLPTFNPKTAEERETLKEVIEKIASYRDYDALVFDVRGNGGGNSQYPIDLLTNLYGTTSSAPHFQKLMGEHYVEWRASSDNIEFVKQWLPELERDFGKDSESVRETCLDIEGMEKSKAVGNVFYRTRPDSKAIQEPCYTPCPVHARVAVITDGDCVSSCLIFIDHLFALEPAAVQVGLPTNVDTDYTEGRVVELPSDLARLHFPIKVRRNRPRKAYQGYIPQYPVHDIKNDEDVKKALQKALILP